MFFFKQKKAPPIREFIYKYLETQHIASDEEILNEYWRRYMSGWNYSAMIKKGHSILRTLRDMRQMWNIKEYNRVHREIENSPKGSDEVFYIYGEPMKIWACIVSS